MVKYSLKKKKKFVRRFSKFTKKLCTCKINICKCKKRKSKSSKTRKIRKSKIRKNKRKTSKRKSVKRFKFGKELNVEPMPIISYPGVKLNGPPVKTVLSTKTYSSDKIKNFKKIAEDNKLKYQKIMKNIEDREKSSLLVKKGIRKYSPVLEISDLSFYDDDGKHTINTKNQGACKCEH